MTHLADRIHTFGRAMLTRHGERVHKIALDAGFTCSNRDGSKGMGGCGIFDGLAFSSQGPNTPHGLEAATPQWRVGQTGAVTTPRKVQDPVHAKPPQLFDKAGAQVSMDTLICNSS
jgi:hypothetical protein